MAESKPAFKRVVLKISGEGLAGEGGFGLGTDALARIAEEIRSVHEAGAQVAVVVGGGNIVRGAALAEQSKIPEVTAHHMGMLATVINALALQESLESIGLSARVLSSIAIASLCEPYARDRCLEHLAAGRIVLLAAGTGRPFVTTDTAAALAAVELDADVVLKATKVDGVYSDDPVTHPEAEFYAELTYDRVIDERLKVMDISAIDLCQRGGVPIIVFNLLKPGNMKRVIAGQKIGTLIA